MLIARNVKFSREIFFLSSEVLLTSNKAWQDFFTFIMKLLSVHNESLSGTPFLGIRGFLRVVDHMAHPEQADSFLDRVPLVHG